MKNIFEEGELSENSVVKDFLTTAVDGKKYLTKFYNLDAIISIGYRINSTKATQFRIWATKTLKNYLTEGYVINKNLLQQQKEKFATLQQTVDLLNRSLIKQVETLKQAKDVSNILNNFVKGLNLLDDYDHQQLDKKGNSKRKAVRIKTEDFLKIVDKMKGDFASDVFAVPKDKSFESSVNQVYQTFGGQELYPTLEEKAAMLLYMVVKNHSFVDGNKRIAASCFLYFLDRNKMLYDKINKPVIDSATLFALTLLIAESNPKDKDIIMQVVISVLNRK
ncbi:RhuM family protein [Candidatus Ruminimicrobium bovinum]|uniref:RhuM family protein n=1 Tax=Candidatus Ruminimicrobium bovinum TaxID=3242779 RepID=UPI0039B8ECB4